MNAPHKTIEAEALPQWRLDDLYTGRDDPRIEADLAAAKAANDALVALKGRFVADRAAAKVLGELLDRSIRLYEDATNLLWSVGAYAGLASSVARDDPAWAKFEGDLRTRSSQIAAESLFFTLELNELEDGEIEAALSAHPPAAHWRPWLRHVRLSRPHELTPDLERMLIDRAPAVANWTRLYDETLARLTAKVGRESLTLPETLNRLSHPDAAQREAAVVEAYPSISHRYYRLKARVMGKRVLDHWDRNAPLTADQPRHYGWDEAKAIVLQSYASLAPKFATNAQVFFDNPWIDAQPRAGKQSGAYSHPVTSTRHPYVFLNYMGERRDVLTLAHELGHAVHQTLASPHGTLLADTPLTLAETASIFGEGLVFERMLGEATGLERRALLAGKIEDALNTVVRQIAFHRFETQFHDRRAAGEVSADQIGRLWLDVMGESLGPAIKLNRGYEHYWAYVSHFVHAPFYVYAYAFGNLLVEALMDARRKDPAAFSPLYEDLLSAGGVKTYVEALAPFGLDPRQKAFWAGGCANIARLVDEFEALV
jgi:oligoendopeptidase F